MSLSAASVRRPVFTVMAALIVATLGAFALSRLPIDLMPELTYPVISVTTVYENAAPREIEELVTKPIERAVAAIPGAEEIASVSQEGQSQVTIKFDWGRNLDEATNDIRDRLDRVIGALPDDAERPLLRKFDTAAMPIMFLGVESEMHPVDLRRFVDDEVVYRLERSPGVASASTGGGLIREIHVEVNPDKIKALNLDLRRLTSLIAAENLTEAGGEIDSGRLSLAVRTLGEFASLADLGAIAVARGPEQSIVRLRDIAEVEDGWAKVSRIVRVNGKNGMFSQIFKQSGSNTVAVADQVNRSLEDINQALPNVRLTPLFDSSTYIRQSIRAVTGSAVEGAVLATLIILIFLQSVRSTIILSLAIPLSIVATFMGMYFWGMTLNTVTLGALALGVGRLVDDAIVVLENIFRLRAEGLPPAEAAWRGADEVAGAVIASTLTALAVFLPMIFLDGMAGIMFRPFSWTITFALAASLAVSLTLTPMLAARLLTDRPGRTASGREIKFGEPRYGRRWFKMADEVYARALAKALARPRLALGLAFAAVGLSLVMVPAIGTEFLPRTDEAAFRVNLVMAAGTRLEKTDETMRRIEAAVADQVPELLAMAANVGGSGGGGGAGGGHTGSLRARLTPAAARKRSVFEIMDDLRPRLSGLPGAEIRLRADQSFFAGGGTGDKIQVELRGDDLAEAGRLSRLMKEIVARTPGVTDVQISNEDAAPEEVIVIDRDRAADAGLSVAQISAVVKTALGGTQAGNYREGGKEYAIRARLKDADKSSIEDLLGLTVVNGRGERTALRSVARAVSGAAPLLINRKDQSRITTISADFSGRKLSDVLADIDLELRKLPLSREFSYAFVGEAKEQAETFAGLRNVFILALFLVYMVMACQFEQLKGPLAVMFSAPFAVIGVVMAHFFTGTTFNINSFIGIIMLVGIVVSNAILLVDHANLLRRRDGLDMDAALKLAGARRLRPILMTSLTTILGLIPLALGLGEGGETQAPLARTVIGGLATSTFITLLVAPSIYKLLNPRA